MTRNEAVSITMSHLYPVGDNGARKWCERYVDNFVALGILKLDEDEDDPAINKAAEAIIDCGIESPALILRALWAAGLKIVEK